MNRDAPFAPHRDLPREGPRTARDVRWALSVAGRPARAIDAGCGPGADTVTLAEALPEARTEAVDWTPHFVAGARAFRAGCDLPPEARIARLRPGAPVALAEVLDAAERETAPWRAAPAEVACLPTVAAPA